MNAKHTITGTGPRVSFGHLGGLDSGRDTEILRSIKTLETINDKPVAEFWKEVDDRQ